MLTEDLTSVADSDWPTGFMLIQGNRLEELRAFPALLPLLQPGHGLLGGARLGLSPAR